MPPARASPSQGARANIGLGGLSRRTTRWVDPPADGAPRPISASTAGDARCWCGSPPARPGDNLRLLPLIDESASPPPGSAVTHGVARTASSQTRPTPIPRPEERYAVGNPRRHPREKRPDRLPHQQGQPRRQATALRCRAVPGPQVRRASLQPPQGLARHRHPLRQTRPQLPSRRHPRLHRPVLGTRGVPEP
jgi:hypothetical protein